MIMLIAGIAAFLVVAGVVVVIAMRADRTTDAAAVDGAPIPITSTSMYRQPATAIPTTRTTTPPPSTTIPPGYREVTGPGGIIVGIPRDWQVRPGAVPSNQQADDPTSPGDLLRFGGSPSTTSSLLESVAQNETDNSGIKDGYQRLKLQRASTQAGLEAVEWEFLFAKDGGTRHARGLFWRLNGTDFVVYASGSTTTWPRVQPVFEVMVRTAGPK
ncbi:hypothetical protein [Umezawaea tangerina]|nr:hypothetical protein [Umezawaea tangerina]